MFYNWYQTGSSLELFNPNSKDLLSSWLFTGNVKKIYDKTTKSSVHFLNIGGLSKMQMPKSKDETLGIVQGYLVFQIYLFDIKNFSIEIAICDTDNVKHRLIFSTHLKDFSLNYFTCLIPLGIFPIGIWCNLSIDVLSFVTYCFKDLTFKSIDGIVLTASCKVRRIFTMRNKIKDTQSNNNNNISALNNSALSERESESEIPSKYLIPSCEGIDVINVNMNVTVVQRYLESVYGIKINKKKSKSKSSSPNNSRFYTKTNSDNKSFISNQSSSSKKSPRKYIPNNGKGLSIVKETEKPNLQLVVEKPNIQIKNIRDEKKEVHRYKMNPEEIDINKPVIISNSESSESKKVIDTPQKQLNTYDYMLKSKDTRGSVGSIEEVINTNTIHEPKNMISDKDTFMVIDKYSKESKEKTKNMIQESLIKEKIEDLGREMLKESTILALATKESRDRPYSPPLTKISQEVKK